MRRRPVLPAPLLPEVLRGRILELRGDGPGPDAARERLHDPDHRVDRLRADPGPDRRHRGGAVRAHPVRVHAEVDVEERPMGPFEEDPLPRAELSVQEDRRVRHVRGKLLAVPRVLPEDRLRVEDVVAPVRLEEPLLDRHDRLELVLEHGRVHEVRHPDPEPPDLVLVHGSDPPPRGPRLHLPLQVLLDAVLDPVVRHHDVRAVADPQVLRVVAPHPQVLELLEERRGLDDDAVPDHVHRRGPQDPRGHEVERVLLLPDEHGVARVRASMEADDEIRRLREVIDHLALALVPELTTQNYGPWHSIARTSRRTNSCSSRFRAS